MTGLTQETLDSSKLAACTSQVSYLHFIDFVLVCFGEFIFLSWFVWLTQEGKRKWSSSEEPTSTAMRLQLTRRKRCLRYLKMTSPHNWHISYTDYTRRWHVCSVAVARWKMLWTASNKCCQPSLQQCQYMIPHLVQKAGQSWLRHSGRMWRVFSKRIEINEFKLAWTTSLALFPLFWAGCEAWRGSWKITPKERRQNSMKYVF